MTIAKKNKRAAMEMSVGTIVTIVLLMTVLIMGLVFTKRIMCAGIQITDDIIVGAQNEVSKLFAVGDYGVKCAGEGLEEVKIPTGKQNKIGCGILVDESTEYQLTVKEVKVLQGTITNVKPWILDQDWKGNVNPGKLSTETVLLLNIPKDAGKTTLKITIEEKNIETGAIQPHTSLIYVEPLGAIAGALC